ncbi:MAG: hypothetical protein FDZ75_08675, partial [Actinobacteria bacterium]
MDAKVPSRYTLTLFGIAMAITLAGIVGVAFQVGGEAGVKAIADIQEMVVVWLAAIVILRSSWMLGADSPVGRPWFWIGVGAAMYAIGDTIWTIIEVGMGLEVNYPGIPDIFYLAEYPFFAAGILMAGYAYRELVDIRRPNVLAALVGGILSIGVFAALLWPTVISVSDISRAEKIVSTLYPMGDIILMITPAMFMLFVVAQLGGGRLAWPWWAVASGAGIIALADILYA